MKKIILSLTATILVLGFAFFIFENKVKAPDTQTTNQQMIEKEMETSQGLEIQTESDLAYFPAAKGYLAKPKQIGQYPGIVMIHENRGLRPEIKATANQLAKEGYIVLAVDLFNGEVLENQDQARAKTKDFDQESGLNNLKSAVEFLKKSGAIKIASLGWCFGGRQSVELSISGIALDATVVYYGGNMATTKDKLEPIKWPVLGIFGDKDTVIPIEKVEEFKKSLNDLSIKNEVHIYPGVGHAFANPSGQNYAPNETKDAWKKTLSFLNLNLKK